MLLYGATFEEADVILSLASGLSVQGPFTNRSFRDFTCIQNRQRLLRNDGDTFTLIEVYR